MTILKVLFALATVATNAAASCPEIEAVASTECPANADMISCDTPGLEKGDLCEGDGECGTDDDLDNCEHDGKMAVSDPRLFLPSRREGGRWGGESRARDRTSVDGHRPTSTK